MKYVTFKISFRVQVNFISYVYTYVVNDASSHCYFYIILLYNSVLAHDQHQ